MSSEAASKVSADLIWNRACSSEPQPDWGPGDRSLHAVLRFHGYVMNGGLLHAFELSPGSEIEESVSGFRFFGFDEVASGILSVADRYRCALRLSDEEADFSRVEALEVEANEMYYSSIPEDRVIEAGFMAVLEKAPALFAGF